MKDEDQALSAIRKNRNKNIQRFPFILRQLGSEVEIGLEIFNNEKKGLRKFFKFYVSATFLFLQTVPHM